MENLICDSIQVIHRNVFIDEYKEMVWHGFFTSRDRGIAFNKHFPIERMHGSDFFYLYEGHQLVGGVSLVPCNINKQVGIISLVYIEEAFRGKGLLEKMLNAVIEFSAKKYVALTLWTNKSYLYEKYGFSKYDKSFCIEFENINVRECSLIQKNTSFKEYLIPSFSKSIDTYHKGNSCVVISSNIDASNSICRYSGDIEDITDIIMNCKGEILCNFTEKDEIVERLKYKLAERKISFKEYKPKLQMWLGNINFENFETYDLLDRL